MNLVHYHCSKNVELFPGFRQCFISINLWKQISLLSRLKDDWSGFLYTLDFLPLFWRNALRSTLFKEEIHKSYYNENHTSNQMQKPTDKKILHITQQPKQLGSLSRTTSNWKWKPEPELADENCTNRGNEGRKEGRVNNNILIIYQK